MTTPTKLNLKIYQGSTFKTVLRWESATVAYAPITSIPPAAPTVLTSVGHGIPAGWRAKIVNVGGMKEINNATDYITIDSISSNTVTINSINSLGYTAYTSGGVLVYNVPQNLAAVTARMQIRSKISDTTFIDELTTENGKILIDNTTSVSRAVPINSVTSIAYIFFFIY